MCADKKVKKFVKKDEVEKKPAIKEKSNKASPGCKC